MEIVIRFTPRPFYLPQKYPDARGTGGRVAPTVLLGRFGVEKTCLILLGFEPVFFRAVN